MSNEKIYMSVEETNRLHRKEKGLYLNDSLLLLDDDILTDTYKNRTLTRIENENSVGVMTVPLNGPKRIIRKNGYCVYVNDNSAKMEWNSNSYLNFSAALYLARNFYIAL